MKKFQCCFALVAVAMFAACGDDGGGNPDSRPRADAPPTIDSPPQIDAPPACTQIEVGAPTFGQGDAGFIFYFSPVTTDLGDGGEVFLQYEFYNGFRPGGVVGTWDLTDAIDGNYATCATCLHLVTLDAAGEAVVRHFFQTAGSATITADPFTTFNMLGSLDGVILSEVTIDQETFESTVVPGGECLTFTQPFTLNGLEPTPTDWTCADDAWRDLTMCDCACGVADPDCGVYENPVNGCTGTQHCIADACVTGPANDTCDTAIALTLGTARNGTLVNAFNNYNNGLEAGTCTGFGQPGGDVAYRVNLTAGTAYTFTINNIQPAASFDPSLSLIDSADPTCGDSPLACLAGADAGVAGDPETFTFTPTATGEYRLIVDSFFPAGNPNGSGTFRIRVTAN